MTSLPVTKSFMFGAFSIVFLLASLTLLACRPEEATSDEMSVVWESWGIIKSSYVEGDTLDSKQAAGNMIGKMLAVGEKPSYPFLTELESVKSRAPRNVPRELIDVWRAWTLFREKWPEVSPKPLTDAAIEGMLDTLADDSAVHLTAESYERTRESLEGTYEGIGAFVSVEDGKVVLSPMEDGPADRAGVERGDATLAVDGDPVVGKSLKEVVERVRGPAGTKVTLLIERSGEPEPLEFNVIRGDISLVSVSPQLLPGAIGYMYISDFQANTPDDVLDVLEDLSQLDTLALILDLRSNPGGSIESAHKVASQFLSDGLFMYEIDKNGGRKDWQIETGGLATDAEKLPMVVLVDGFTGSAAEAVAAALQDAERAKVIGVKTVGKGSANVLKELSDGSAIYIAVSHWYTPLGRVIQGNGVKPDIEATLTAQDRALGIDSQLAKAYDYLDDLLPFFQQ